MTEHPRETIILLPLPTPGIYYQDQQGAPWSTVSCVNHQETCCVCGKLFTRGYVKGRYGEEAYYCGCNIHTMTH